MSLLDLRSDRLDLAWDAGDDAVVTFEAEAVNTTGWVNTFAIYATADNGDSGTGAALIELTDASGITNTPGADSEIEIVIPAAFSAARSGQVLYCRFRSTISGRVQSHSHGRIDIQ